MAVIPEILEYNREFVASKKFEAMATDRFPNRKIVVLTCMDTRLTELLPQAMGLRNGDAKFLKTAGAVISHPWGSIMRSILLAIYELGAQDVAVVGHHDCGFANMRAETMLQRAIDRGVPALRIETIRSAGIDLDQWLTGFASPEEGVKRSVAAIRRHPLLPMDVVVHGLLVHPHTGLLETIEV